MQCLCSCRWSSIYFLHVTCTHWTEHCKGHKNSASWVPDWWTPPLRCKIFLVALQKQKWCFLRTNKRATLMSQNLACSLCCNTCFHSTHESLFSMWHYLLQEPIQLPSLLGATGHLLNRLQLGSQILGHLYNTLSLVKRGLGSTPATNTELAD